MCNPKTSRHFGFVLIEALIALLLISVGLVAVSKLQVLSLSGSGDAKAYSEAVTLSQRKLEELRNILIKTQYTTSQLASGTETATPTNTTFTLTWTVQAIVAGNPEKRSLQLTTTWTDRSGNAKSLSLDSLIAWDDPGAQAKLSAPPNGQLISPTGAALRSVENLGVNVGSLNPDGSKTYRDTVSLKTYLLKANGDVLLYLPPKNGSAQSFTTITGKILFDQNASNNSIPNSNNVRVRLSSEGECIYNNVANQMTAVTGGTNSYKYFTYTCYVGPGWYGNVGVLVDDSVNGNAGSPTICVGDPAFNNGVSDSTLISAHPLEAATRSYRGFKGTTGNYLSTGVASGGKYGKSYVLSGGTTVLDPNGGNPFDGRPVPSAYPSFYPTIVAGSATDYFEQNFLITHISGNASCSAKMTGGIFARNAGKYVCINPDNDPAVDVCPPIWPGFEGEVGSGGSINYALTVLPAGTGTGTVTSSPTGISCGTTCSASYATGTTIALTAVAASGSSFTGWSGCTTQSGNTCTVLLSGPISVTPTFDPVAVPDTLTVTRTGTGSGTVTSGDSNISCGSVCSYTYGSVTSVTLTASAVAGDTFTGWSGGGCSGTGTCTVSVSGATAVTATFAAPVTYLLTVTRVGTGTVTGSGISCGSTCTASYSSGATVTLSAAPVAGTTFTGWSGGGCSGAGSCMVPMTSAQNVTATFTPNANCTTPISGTAHNSAGSVTASSGGNCPMDNGNVSTYRCSLSAPSGTVITLTNAKTNGQVSTQYSYSQTVTANCMAQTNVNFP